MSIRNERMMEEYGPAAQRRNLEALIAVAAAPVNAHTLAQYADDFRVEAGERDPVMPARRGLAAFATVTA